MDIKAIVKALQKEGYSAPTSYASFIENCTDVWFQWYKGFVNNFHKYQVLGGQSKTVEATRSTLNMAKTVSEDWASFLLNEKTYINLDDKPTQKYLVGDDLEQESGMLGESGFWVKANKLVERAYALGTCAVVATIANAKMKNNIITEGKIKLKYIKNPNRIIPLKWEDNEIIDCAFISTYVLENNSYFNAHIHQMQPNGSYKIKNMEFIKKNDEYVRTKFEGVESYTLNKKAFFILKPNLENNLYDDLPLGLSIYSTAIDAFKTTDLSYTNFDSDFLLGRKKIFMSQDLVATTMSDGVAIPDTDKTAETSMFVLVPEMQNPEGKKMLFEEYNPAIRVEENTKGIQTGLNMISFKCQLGSNFYDFDKVSRTVYQNTDSTKANTGALQKSIAKQRIAITEFLKELVTGVLSLAKQLGEVVDPESKLSIQFDESFFTDEKYEKEQFLKEIAAGVRKKHEYRMKFFGESEEEAKKNTEDEESDVFTRAE